MKNLIKTLTLGSIFLLAQPDMGYADTATGNLTVTASVAGTCTVDGVAPLSFGAYDNTQKSASAAITYTCTTPLTTANFTLNGGNNESGGNRRMASGGNYLVYTLYTDSNYANPWTINGVTVPATVDGTQKSDVTIYGRIEANAGNTAGSYTDTVTVTLTFNND